MDTARWPSHRTLRLITLGGILIIVICMAYGYWSLQSDDAYIFYSYVKNIAHGHGYVFNAGQHVNATSSALYTLLLALIFLPFKTAGYELIPLLGHLLGIISLAGTAVFLMLTFERNGGPVLACVVPVVFLGSPFVSAGTGMEMPLALFCVAGALYFYVKESHLLTGLALGLAVLARPDMVLFAVVMFIHFLFTQRKLPSIGAFALFALPIAAWLIFSWSYFGSVIPTTLSAKLSQTASGLWGEGRVYWKGFGYGPYWYREPPFAELFVLPIALIGLIATAARRSYRRVFSHPAVTIIVVWNITHLITYGVILDAPAYEWYYCPYSLGIGLLTAIGISRVVYFIVEDLGAAARIVLPAILSIVIVVASAMPLRLINDDFPSIYYSYRASAEWLNKNALAGSSVGANDIGMLRFFYENGPVICAGGLVNPEVIPHLVEQDFEWYVHRYEPDYLMFITAPKGIMVQMILDDWFKAEYELMVSYKHGWRTIGVYQRLRSGS